MKKSVLYSVALGCALGVFSGATLFNTEAYAADGKMEHKASKKERAIRVLKELRERGYSRDLAMLYNVAHIKREFKKKGFDVVVEDDASWTAKNGRMRIKDLAYIFKIYAGEQSNMSLHFTWGENEKMREDIRRWFGMIQGEFAELTWNFDMDGNGVSATGWTKGYFDRFYRKYTDWNKQKAILWADYVKWEIPLTSGAQNIISRWNVRVNDLVNSY